MSRFRHFRVCSGQSNPELAERIALNLGVELGEMVVDRFADGECQIQYKETVRGVDVFLVQSTSRPVNENIMELLLMIDAARRASAARITAVIPYFGYARQDRKNLPRVPISAKLVANLLQEAGTDRVLTMNLHADQIQGFFDIPVDHLYSTPIVIDYLSSALPESGNVVIAPDAGAANRSRYLAKSLGYDLAIIDKRRPKPNESKVAHIIGEVQGKNAIIVDDMVDTAGTMTQAAHAIDRAGARSVRAVATHPIFSDPALQRIADSPLEEVAVCDTISLREDVQQSGRITVLNTHKMLAQAIRCIHEESSITQQLFAYHSS